MNFGLYSFRHSGDVGKRSIVAVIAVNDEFIFSPDWVQCDISSRSQMGMFVCTEAITFTSEVA